jgi:uncharacterized membrane protein
MNFIENLNGFLTAIPVADGCALAWFAACWIGYTVYSGHEGWARRSLMRGTDRLRAAWMKRMLDREVRIVDAALLNTLMLSVSFFASTAILIVGSLIAALGTVDREMPLTANLGFLVAASRETWTFRLFSPVGVFIYAFFELTWSIRQFDRRAILIDAAPPHDQLDDARRQAWARCLGRLNALAGDDFNRGLRAYCFGLALLAVRSPGDVRRRLGRGRGGFVPARVRLRAGGVARRGRGARLAAGSEPAAGTGASLVGRPALGRRGRTARVAIGHRTRIRRRGAAQRSSPRDVAPEPGPVARTPAVLGRITFRPARSIFRGRGS